MAEDIKMENQTNENVDGGQEQLGNGSNTKVYMTQDEVDTAIEKRLLRERRKAENRKDEAEGKESGEQKNEIEKTKQQDNSRLELLEAKLICYDAGVKKDCVSDVVALAKAYTDDDTTFDEAVEKVLKKYPQFQNNSNEQEKNEEDKKGTWGQRQGNSGTNDTDGVERAFLKRNPGLKID